ncbi:MAG: hypothetical protein LBJ00_01060 [Planctomycetaceae bacterium]|nr:hypothetical protein [Planctomycetaceae bacterium]
MQIGSQGLQPVSHDDTWKPSKNLFNPRLGRSTSLPILIGHCLSQVLSHGEQSSVTPQSFASPQGSTQPSLHLPTRLIRLMNLRREKGRNSMHLLSQGLQSSATSPHGSQSAASSQGLQAGLIEKKLRSRFPNVNL